MSNIQLDIEWTEAASRKIEKLMPRNANKDAYLALPPIECLPMEATCFFSGRPTSSSRLSSLSASIITKATPTGLSS